MYIHRDGEYEPITRTPPSFTNGDRIRSMSDEELAAWLAGHPVVSMYDGSNPQHKAWLNWLKAEEHDEID